MGKREARDVDAIVDRFVEGLFLLILSHHQEQLSEMDLTMPQAQALRLLYGAPLSTGTLAATLGISAPAVSQLTDRLIRKQLIERRTAEADRRSVNVELTTKGTRLVDAFRRRRADVFAQALLKLNEPDRNEVIDALEKIARVLQPPATEAEQKVVGGRLVERPAAQTPVQRQPTSNESGRTVVSPRKRMRIEWD
jgi:MarR family multiple gene transcriptional regulator MgrA